MNIVTKAGVTGLAPHPSDYYEITADLDMAQQTKLFQMSDDTI